MVRACLPVGRCTLRAWGIRVKKVKFLGYAITAVSFYYILKVVLALNFDLLTALEAPVRTVIYLLGLSAFYSVLMVIASFSWKLILEFLSNSRLSGREVFEVYAKSNIAKYLPGNILHFAGRNLLGKRLDWKHADTLVGSLLEMAIMLLTAVLLLLVLSPGDSVALLTQALSTLARHPVVVSLLSVLLAALIYSGISLWVKRNVPWGYVKIFFTKRFSIVLAEVFLIDCLLLLSLGFTLLLIYQGVLRGTGKTGQPLYTISAFILSWVAGFVTPGAPGGIGVRESVQILMLSPVYGKESALAAAVLFRVVSILGELISFFYASFFLKPSKKSEPAA